MKLLARHRAETPLRGGYNKDYAKTALIVVEAALAGARERTHSQRKRRIEARKLLERIA